MKFEVLKKGNRKKWIVSVIATVGIISVGILAASYAKYQSVEDIELVKGAINYKPYDFKVMAMYKSDDGTNYTEITDMPKGYIVNEEKSYCTTDNVNKVYGKVKTSKGEHVVTNLKKNDKCYVYFDKYKDVETVLGTLKVNFDVPDFSKIATTDEGIYATYDELYGGYSYYWRGAATTNYVKFGGYCWRIIRINGDGTIRLIYDGATCHANGEVTEDSITVKSRYNPNYNKSEYVGWKYTIGSQRPSSTTEGTNATIITALENWYTTNLASYESYIADGKYCNDRNVASGYTWTSTGSFFRYAARQRLETYAPTLRCDVLDTYTLKAGLITSDEVMYAGAKETASLAVNKSFYLCNGYSYWTMSPYTYTGDNRALVFFVNGNGELYYFESHSSALYLRPVINLRAASPCTGGIGTIDNPYFVPVRGDACPSQQEPV